MAELLISNGVVVSDRYKLPDVKAYAGDVLWVETENSLYSDVYISTLLGLLHANKGELKFFDADVSYCNISDWVPNVVDASSLCKLYAYSRGHQISASLNELKRILASANADHIINMSLKDMVKSTRSLLSWAISLSTPALSIILNDPYYGLDKEAFACLSSELENVAKDGSLVIIVAQERPPIFNKQVSFR